MLDLRCFLIVDIGDYLVNSDIRDLRAYATIANTAGFHVVFIEQGGPASTR